MKIQIPGNPICKPSLRSLNAGNPGNISWSGFLAGHSGYLVLWCDTGCELEYNGKKTVTFIKPSKSLWGLELDWCDWWSYKPISLVVFESWLGVHHHWRDLLVFCALAMLALRERPDYGYGCVWYRQSRICGATVNSVYPKGSLLTFTFMAFGCCPYSDVT